MKPDLRLCIALPLTITVALAFAQAAKPTVTIDYKTHERLWRAQRAIVTAYEHVDAAAESQAGDSANHTRKAQELLLEADRELQLAASSSRK